MSSTKASQVSSSVAKLRSRKKNSTQSLLSQNEAKQIELDSLRAKLKLHNLQNDELQSIIDLRKVYSERIMWFTIFWTLVTLFFTISTAWKWWGCQISDSVLITLIGTSFGNVIALATVVAKGIFTRES